MRSVPDRGEVRSRQVVRDRDHGYRSERPRGGVVVFKRYYRCDN